MYDFGGGAKTAGKGWVLDNIFVVLNENRENG
jgi:hypothetical protein